MSTTLIAVCAIGLLVGCGSVAPKQSEKISLPREIKGADLRLFQVKGPFSIYISKSRQAPYEEFVICDGSGPLIWRDKSTNEFQTFYFRRGKDILVVAEGTDGGLKRVSYTFYDEQGQAFTTFMDTEGRGEWNKKIERGQLFLRDETRDCWKPAALHPAQR